MIEDTLRGVETATGVRIELDYEAGYPVTVNDPATIAKSRRLAIELFGEFATLNFPEQAGPDVRAG